MYSRSPLFRHARDRALRRTIESSGLSNGNYINN